MENQNQPGQNTKKILIADDDLDFTRTYKKLLERAGFGVIEAHNGEEAVRIAMKSHPDLVMIDMAMPEKSGIMVLKELRSDPWGKELPIIILTGKDAGDQELKDLSALNPTYYLIKGNEDSEELINKIRDLTS